MKNPFDSVRDVVDGLLSPDEGGESSVVEDDFEELERYTAEYVQKVGEYQTRLEASSPVESDDVDAFTGYARDVAATAIMVDALQKRIVNHTLPEKLPVLDMGATDTYNDQVKELLDAYSTAQQELHDTILDVYEGDDDEAAQKLLPTTHREQMDSAHRAKMAEIEEKMDEAAEQQAFEDLFGDALESVDETADRAYH